MPTRIDSLTYELDDLSHDVAGEAYESYMLPYDSAVRGTIQVRIDGQPLLHENKLPARFDVVDTARAHYEVVDALDREGTFSGFPFCCTCGDRGCAYIKWEATLAADGSVDLEMQDLGGREVGEFRYVLAVGTLRDAVMGLLDAVIGFMEESGIRRIEGADRTDPPDGSDHYASRAELEAYAAAIRQQ